MTKKFNIHFFKEKSRKIDLDFLITFFESIDGIVVEMDEVSVRFRYIHPKLGYEALFLITPKSCVPDIYRLDPKFLDVNFHLEMPILTPNYVAKEVFEIVKRVTDQFNFHVYNELFENVLPFKQEMVFKVYDMVKENYMEKNPIIMKEFFVLPTDKMSGILKYLDEQYALQKYYQAMVTYVPRYHFLSEQGRLALAIEWRENTLTVFPPHLDYVFYRYHSDVKIVKYNDALQVLEKYLVDVPGFIKGTKVVEKKTAKKVYKLMKKTKFPQTNSKFEKVDIKYIID